MRWWEENNIRLIQTNLRQTDAVADTDRLVSQFIDFGANTVLLNTAGIMSFYPSSLPYEYINPYLDGRDFIGELVEKCHANGIRVISRFDFSKIHKSIFQQHPEWAYVSDKGQTIDYNGLIHTCINSEYQNRLSLEIIDEVLDRYHVDGVFFNMFGFVTRDYSNNYHGICHCEACRKRFRDAYGLELPSSEEPGTPGLREYRLFQRDCVDDILQRIYSRVTAHSEGIAVCNYAEEYVDVVMNESNTEMHRPYPIWDYMTSENVSRVYSSSAKVSGNISINASSLDYRFHGVSEHLVRQRFIQSLAACGQLFWCIIGVFDGYQDRKSFNAVKEMFRLHKENIGYFGRRKSISEVAIIYPYKNEADALKEFRGIYTLCKERHILADVIERRYLGRCNLSGYKAIVVPDLDPDDKLMQAVREVSVPVIWTGAAWAESQYHDEIASLFGIRGKTEAEDIKWHYISIKGVSEDTDWCLAEGRAVPFDSGTDMSLELISAGLFGPPELCGGNNPEGRYLQSRSNHGTMIAFGPGTMYHKYGFREHADVVYSSLSSYVDAPIVETDAPSSVEIAISENEKGQILLFLVNHTGFNGRTYNKPAELGRFCLKSSRLGSYHIADAICDGSAECRELSSTGGFSSEIKGLGSYMIVILERERKC